MTDSGLSSSDLQAFKDALAAAGGQQQSSSSGGSMIGVPQGYQPPGAFQGDISNPQQLAQANYAPSTIYSAGDELAPARTPDSAPLLQSQLVNAGLLDVKSVRPGVWDSKSQSAYKQVLAYANQNGISAQDAMNILIANKKIGDTTSGRAPLTIQETSPLDIAAAAQDSATKLLGRRLTDAELQPFVAQYQQTEKAAQQKAYKVGDPTGKGGAYVAPPSLSSASDAFLQDQQKLIPEEMAYAGVEKMNEFMQLLHSPTGAG